MSIGFEEHNDRIVRGNSVFGQRLSGDLPHSECKFVSRRGTHQRSPLAALSQGNDLLFSKRYRSTFLAALMNTAVPESCLSDLGAPVNLAAF